MEPVDLSFPFYTIQAIREESGKPFQAVLAVEQSHAIVCEIDLNSLTVRVPRIPLTLDAVRPIAAGWTAKISIVRENDDPRNAHTLRESIVLPMIAPTVALAGTDRRAAIEGGIAPIPRDIAESRARWRVFVHIVDPLLEEAAIYTSPPAEFQTVS